MAGKQPRPLRLDDLPPARQTWYRLLRKIRPHILGGLVKRVAGVRRFWFRSNDGLVFWLDPVSNLAHFLMEGRPYEPEVTAVIEQLLRPGDVFVDAGASEGFHMLMAARAVGEKGVVHAFEPQHRQQPILRRNIRANGFHGIVHLHRAALSDRKGELTLFLTAEMNTGATSIFRHRSTQLFREQVPCIDLDTWAIECGLERIRLMKIDCEGAETLILPGTRRLIEQQRIDHLVIEFHPHFCGEQACRSAEKILTDNGYAKKPVGASVLFSRPGTPSQFAGQ